MSRQKYQSGFAHLIIIIILAVALVGSVGYIVWQNLSQPKTETSKTDSSKSSDSSSTDATADTTSSNAGYLVLDDWSVKFKLPANVNDTITYYKIDANSYAFSTKSVEALGGSCVAPGVDGHVQYMYYENRQTVPQSDQQVSGGILSGKIGNYYYYRTKSQAPCFLNDSGEQAAALDLLEDTLLAVEVK